MFLGRLLKDSEVLEEYYRRSQCPQDLKGSGESPSALVQKAVISVEITQAHMKQTFAESSRVLEAVSDSLCCS